MTDPSQRQTLEFEFEVSGTQKGIVVVSVEPDLDPEHYGMHLLFPDKPMEYFRDFPLCEATVKSTSARGYGSMYGWVQMVRCGEGTLSDTDKWEMDPIPITNDLNTPFVWFGAEPRLFDGPSRPRDKDVDWVCHSFLTRAKCLLLERDVRPILGFEWGFWIRDRRVTVKPLRKLDMDAWDDHLDLFRSNFSGWTFNGAER